MPATSAGEDLLRGVWKENPVFVQLLGLCPALAVTNTVVNGLAMGVATAFVLVGSSLIVSAFKAWVPHAVRISTYVLIVGTFVTVVDMVMQATAPSVHRALGAFVYLIVVNCMILGRHEAFSSKQPVFRSLLDAAGTSVGFLLALVLMGGVRELLGSGSFFGHPVFGPGFQPWLIMVLPPGGFLTIGFILLGLNAWQLRGGRGWSRGRTFQNPVTSAGRAA